MTLGATILRKEFIYEHAPFPSCHAATIAQTKTGKLVAAWFGGTAESNPDVKIYFSERGKDGWSSPRMVADGDGLACYNPVLFQAKSGSLLLFYKVGRGPQTWWGMESHSEDEGKTWSKPARLPDGILGPIKNKPFELWDGALLCPSSSEDHGWQVHFEVTRDLGRTWMKTNPINDGKAIGAIQPSILQLGPHHLRAIGRTQQGSLFSVDSNDDGQTWGAMKLTDLPNPNSGTDAITLRDGRHVLVYNPTKQGRTPLVVAISNDAEHWTQIATLEDEPGEYSYPSLIQSKDGHVHIVYTWRRQRIRHVELVISSNKH